MHQREEAAISRHIKKVTMILICVTFLTGCAENLHNERNDNAFFPFGQDYVEYHTSFYFSDSVKDAGLQVVLKEKYADGLFYELKIDYEGEIEEYDKERLWLGYFFVTDDKIYRVADSGQDEVWIPDDFYKKGTVVCQEETKEDYQRSDGMNEYIKADGDICQYGRYNTLTETGFYERLVWEKGKGLVQYASGFGAERDKIEIIVK